MFSLIEKLVDWIPSKFSLSLREIDIPFRMRILVIPNLTNTFSVLRMAESSPWFLKRFLVVLNSGYIFPYSQSAGQKRLLVNPTSFRLMYLRIQTRELQKRIREPYFIRVVRPNVRTLVAGHKYVL